MFLLTHRIPTFKHVKNKTWHQSTIFQNRWPPFCQIGIIFTLTLTRSTTSSGSKFKLNILTGKWLNTSTVWDWKIHVAEYIILPDVCWGINSIYGSGYLNTSIHVQTKINDFATMVRILKYNNQITIIGCTPLEKSISTNVFWKTMLTSASE